ncbi:NmrA family NAD(P)-binding protein [Nostoc sp. MS1]|uniref:NmrA family NAD(P)-binding protein n=1 Tax=Nostoc sp. MS1 TaxID=2764711 RepID=UPI001CC67D0C|nr:NmrA family NAD(P)-binding protein [Nostoc sp. MS1]BCL34575.1 NmrA family transcriptional regulator [Nostoc sp. MS1]
MPIVVTTPTGNIGHQVVRELLDAGKFLRVITRHPDKLTDAVRAQAEVIQGSTDDAEVLIRAFDGAEAMFWCVPQSHTLENLLDYYMRFTKAAAIAIDQTQIPRVVSVSSGGKGLAKNAGAISALHAMEDLLNETSVAMRHLRCGSFMENFLWQAGAIAHQGKFFYPLPGDYSIPMVSTFDIGTIAAQWLMKQDWKGVQGVAVHGAEELSLNQSAEVFSDVLGKTIQFQQIPPEVYYELMLKHGSSPAFAQGLVDLFAEVAKGIYQAEPRTLETTTSTTLRQWATKVMVPAVAKYSAQMSD